MSVVIKPDVDDLQCWADTYILSISVEGGMCDSGWLCYGGY